ncbi:MAG: hypothetical protein ACI835_004726 [Planctomycetota bacterium]|jgi:hypothetical protein
MDTRGDNIEKDPFADTSPDGRSDSSATQETEAPAAVAEEAPGQAASGLDVDGEASAARPDVAPDGGFAAFSDLDESPDSFGTSSSSSDPDFEGDEAPINVGGPFASGGEENDELSLSEASELVGVSARALRDRVQRGSLAAHKVTREGRVLSVVRRKDLLKVYGWMVAEGERKLMTEPAGRLREFAPAVHMPAAPVSTSPDLRGDLTRMQSTVSDLLAELSFQRQESVKQREQEIRARREHDREITKFHAQAELLTKEVEELRTGGRRDKPAWELVGAVLLLVVVVLGLWIHSQGAESARQRQFDQLLGEIQSLQAR